MVVAAHPDDAEFGCGGTVHKWIREGCRVFYLIGTNGDKGDDSGKFTLDELAALRKQEQLDAARILGVEEVEILPRSDGSLVYSIELRGDVVRYIRKWKPDVLITHDPTVLIDPDFGINHADHRVIGEVALDAVYPFARGRTQYPEQIAEGLEPHRVAHILVWNPGMANHWEDVTDVVDVKLKALFAHKSQFPNPDGMREFTLGCMERAGAERGMRYAEAFRRIDLM
jgi:LmbE family N-acetylglucosaminyl deacetylase